MTNPDLVPTLPALLTARKKMVDLDPYRFELMAIAIADMLLGVRTLLTEGKFHLRTDQYRQTHQPLPSKGSG